MSRTLWVCICLAGLPGCASASSSGRGPEVGEQASKQTDSLAPREPSGEPATEAFNEELPLDPVAPAGEAPRSRLAWSGSPVSLETWGAERGIAANVNAEGCHPAELGAHPEDTLWCLRREEIDDLRVVYYAALYRATGGTLRRLVEVAYGAAPRPLDGEGDEPAYYVRLSAVTAENAQSFELREEPGLECAGAQQRVEQVLHDEPAVPQAVKAIIDEVCGAVGSYSAGGQRLR